MEAVSSSLVVDLREEIHRLEEICNKALPIIAAYCNALGEACPEDAAEVLHLLKRGTP